MQKTAPRPEQTPTPTYVPPEQENIKPRRRTKKPAVSLQTPEQFTPAQVVPFKSAIQQSRDELQTSPDSYTPQYQAVIDWLNSFLSSNTSVPTFLLAKNGGNLRIPTPEGETPDPALIDILSRHLVGPIPGVSILQSPPNEFQPPGAYLRIELSPEANHLFQYSSANPLQTRDDIMAVFKPKTVYLDLSSLPSSKTASAPTRVSVDLATYSQVFNQIISNYLLPSATLQSLPNTAFGNYVRTEYQAWSSKLQTAVQAILPYSRGYLPVQWLNPYNSNLEMNAPPSDRVLPTSVKAGIMATGEPFVMIDRATYERVLAGSGSWKGYFRDAFVMPEPENGELPAGLSILAEGKAAHTGWIWNVKLTADNAESQLSSALLARKQHLDYLASQTNAQSQSSFNQLLQTSGSMTLSTLLDSRHTFSPLVAHAAALLTEGVGPMERLWAERVPFFSFAEHNTQAHQWLVGQKEGTFYVCDVQSAVRGKGSTEGEAILDMIQSIYCPSGLYYYSAKQSNQPLSSPAQELLALPTETWKTDLHDFSEFMGAPTALSLLKPKDPILRWVSIIGLLASSSDQYVSGKDRAFHKGEEWKWGSAEGAMMTADALFVLSQVSGWGRIPSMLGQAAKTFDMATAVSMAGFYGAGMYGQFKHLAAQETAQAQQAGQPITRREGLAEDWDQADELILAPLYMAATGTQPPSNATSAQKKAATATALARIHLEWEPYLKPALFEQVPLGLEGAQVDAAQLMLLAPRGDWINDNPAAVRNMSQWLGWSLEDTVLEILMFGGPSIDQSEANTLQLIRKGRVDDFEQAANYLASHSRSSGMNLDAVSTADQLRLVWLRGQVTTSQVQDWAQQQRDSARLRPSTDTQDRSWSPKK